MAEHEPDVRAPLTPFVDDVDFRLYVGDVLDVLAELPDESVDCCVTSPPYWGLRDYGTGSWDGGDPECDHKKDAVTGRGEDFRKRGEERGYAKGSNFANYGDRNATASDFEDECGKCGARRVDRQIGLEATPELYVQRIVEVFREVRRVLRKSGTCWINLGDSYTSGLFTRQGKPRNVPQPPNDWEGTELGDRGRAGNYALVERTDLPGLKPKDLCGIPWRVAFALQADGWFLRSDIVWSKPNPMPESVTDRPTKSHEYVFLLSKQPRYFFDQEAVREPASYGYSETTNGRFNGRNANGEHNSRTVKPGDGAGGRNVRSVWEIATQPYPDAHFATFPEELPRRCILAGCPEFVCGTCGAPRVRITDGASYYHDRDESKKPQKYAAMGHGHGGVGRGPKSNLGASIAETVGWSDCGHANYQPGVTLDPFMGSGTVALVARRHGRRSIGIELNSEYAELCARRLQQLSLLA